MQLDPETPPTRADSIPAAKAPAHSLTLAALAGLLGLALTPGCSTEKPNPPGPGTITSSEAVPTMTADYFALLCDDRSGTVEVMPHCGGFASAEGFSFDTTTDLLSEHTCKGANTCAGWNCVVDD